MRELFTNEEWSLFRRIPFAVFAMVAGADGVIDAREQARLAKDLKGASASSNALTREIFADLSESDVPALLEEALDLKAFEGQADALKSLLKLKLGPDDYRRFMVSMFLFGLDIAKASGGGFLGMGAKICEEEKAALTRFGFLFDVAPRDVCDALS